MLVKPSAPRPSSPETEPPVADSPAGPAAEVADRLELRTSRRGSLEILHLDGALNAATAVTAEAQILSTIVLAPEPLHLVLDLEGLTRIDTAGIELVAKTRFAVHAARGTLHVVAPAGSPAQLALRSASPRSARNRVERIADVPPRDEPAPEACA